MTEKKIKNTPSTLQFDFSNAPTIAEFMGSKSFIRGLMGPVGSGKSYGCCAEILKMALSQKPSPRDGIKYSRFAIVRNTHPMLRTTTLKTWLELLPENYWGNVKYSPPITHHIKLPARDGAAGVDMEVIFLALDDAKDVRKLLSLELTGAWINEARELPVQIIQGLSHRVGRYPTRSDGGPSQYGIILDTNSMDDDHWYYRYAEKEKPKGKFSWEFFKQPSGVLEIPHSKVPQDMPEAQGYYFASGRWWRTNPKAENLINLPDGYYEQLLGGKSLDWIRCYAEGKYTFVKEGKSVWHEFDPENMIGDELEPDPKYPVNIGLDFGLTPAAVFAQRMPNGRWHILHELVTFDIGLNRFVSLLKSEMELYFPKFKFNVWGDPAGNQRDQIYETTAFQHLNANGILARPTNTNDFRTRREAGAIPMTRLIEGKPGLIVSKKCTQLIKSLNGGYHFQRVMKGSGTEVYKDQPVKNNHSHIGDAFGYALLGGGEHKRMVSRAGQFGNQQQARVLDFDVFS
ncbi:MAG: TerL [Opitutales bacterium]|nr:TerL [Opitutales bacterium]|tara:strand:+ start:15202 stop:16743 length:1542 start_codon:yes stop_codon:yes gene_type:complete